MTDEGSKIADRKSRAWNWCRHRPVAAFLVAAVTLFLVSLGVSAFFGGPDEVTGWYRVVPPLITILTALITGDEKSRIIREILFHNNSKEI